MDKVNKDSSTKLFSLVLIAHVKEMEKYTKILF